MGDGAVGLRREGHGDGLEHAVALGARALLEQVLALRRRVLGDEHPDTLISMNNLAATLYAQGETDRAVALVAEALPVALRKYGPKPEVSQYLIGWAEKLGVPIPPLL